MDSPIVHWLTQSGIVVSVLNIATFGLPMFVADCVHTDSFIFSHNFTQASFIALASNSAKLYLFMSFQILACLVTVSVYCKHDEWNIDVFARVCFVRNIVAVQKFSRDVLPFWEFRVSIW